jgi:hypothetical protein
MRQGLQNIAVIGYSVGFIIWVLTLVYVGKPASLIPLAFTLVCVIMAIGLCFVDEIKTIFPNLQKSSDKT